MNLKKSIFYNIFGIGHISPSLKLIKDLSTSGIEVIYHSSPERNKLLSDHGAIFRNYGRDDYKAADYNPGKNFVLQTIPATLGLLPFLLNEIKTEKPDFLLYDSMAPWGLALAKMTKIPSFCLSAIFALTKNQKQKMFQSQGVVIDDKTQRAIDEIQKKYHITLDFHDTLGAYHEHNLVFSSSTFNPPLLEDEDEHLANSKKFHFIGHNISRIEPINNFPLKKFQNFSGKTILICFGTILPDEDPNLIDLYKLIIETLSSFPKLQIIVSVGNLIHHPYFQDIPSNIFAFSHLPQLTLLKMVDLFITHGGINSIHESIQTKVPMLVLPQSKDQLFNAQRILELNLGEVIYPREISKENLTSKISNLLNEATKYQVLNLPKYQDPFHIIKKILC